MERPRRQSLDRGHTRSEEARNNDPSDEQSNHQLDQQSQHGESFLSVHALPFQTQDSLREPHSGGTAISWNTEKRGQPLALRNRLRAAAAAFLSVSFHCLAPVRGKHPVPKIDPLLRDRMIHSIFHLFSFARPLPPIDVAKPRP